jgi:hypothetical protein
MNVSKEELFDIRVVERNIARGLVTREEYNAWLASVEDSSDLCKTSDVRFTHSGGGRARRAITYHEAD